MMDYPLLLRTFLLRAARYFPRKEIVSVYPSEVFRYTYTDYFRRSWPILRSWRRRSSASPIPNGRSARWAASLQNPALPCRKTN